MSKAFSIEVYCVETDEVFPVHHVCSSTKIIDLKIKLELIAGIPTHLQRIMYLDQGDMEDNSTLKHHDVVSGARLAMHIWSSWSSLIRASVLGDISQVMGLGVTAGSNFRNPNTEQMTLQVRREWFLARSAIALYVAAHRGHVTLMKALLLSGVDITATTKNGRNALHVAAASGQHESVDLLLANGAGHLINVEDKLGETPLQTAATFNHKASERRLFLFQWRKRAAKMKKLSLAQWDDLMAHQLFDSSSCTWLYGEQSQHYQSNILPPQEYQGTRIDSKRSEIGIKKVSYSAPALEGAKKSQATMQSKKVPTIVISEDAILTRGKRKEGTNEVSSQSTKSLEPPGTPSTIPSVIPEDSDTASYRERRLAYLRKYKPEENITVSMKQSV